MSVFKTGKPIEDNELSKIFDHAKIDERKIKMDKIYPSTVGNCPRRAVAQVLVNPDAVSEYDIISRFHFAIGSGIEDVVVDELKEKGVLLAREFKVSRKYKDHEVSGRIDAVITLDGGETINPIEIKSCGKLPIKPKHYQLSQLIVYMVMTGTKVGYMIYISRSPLIWPNKLNKKIFKIKITDHEIEKYSRMLAKSLVFVNEKVLPEKAFTSKSNCNWCPFISFCWEEDDRSSIEILWPELTKLEKEYHSISEERMAELSKTVETLTIKIVNNQEKYYSQFENQVKRPEWF